jgi:antitoxin VapB
MAKFAKLFSNGSSQAVRLPQDFRFRGDRVRIRKQGDEVLLTPVISNVDEWFAEIDSHGSGDAFEGNWRNQPKAPKREILE